MSDLRVGAAAERASQAADIEPQHSVAAVAAEAENFAVAVVEDFAVAVEDVVAGAGRTSTLSTT